MALTTNYKFPPPIKSSNPAIEAEIGSIKIAPAELPLAIDINGVSAGYCKGQQVISNLSLTVPVGEFLALVGPSGCGKTTLLRLISGQLQPVSGRIKCIGSVAVIHQDLKLVKQKSALQNVILGALARTSLVGSVFGFSRSERTKALELLELVGMSHRVNAPVHSLSGGEKQRVAIARALMQNPDVILADEPIAALDDVSAVATMKLLAGICRDRGVTVVTVLHQTGIATAFADRVVTLKQTPDIEQSVRGVRAVAENAREVDFRDDSESTRSSAPVAGPVGLLSSITTWALLALVGVAIVALSTLDFRGTRVSDSSSELGQFLLGMLPRSWSELQALPWNSLFLGLLETCQMALVGTVFGMIISVPLAALAATNISYPVIIKPVRFLLNALRTVPSLLWALLFVAAVGLGPLAGVLALTIYSVGYLTKFFYEAFESVENGPVMALREIGATKTQAFLHALWPASKAAILSSSLFMVEYNVRAASILGIVDAGGIGFYIKEFIDYRYFPAVTASLVLILAVVLVLDWFSSAVRKKLVV